MTTSTYVWIRTNTPNQVGPNARAVTTRDTKSNRTLTRLPLKSTAAFCHKRRNTLSRNQSTGRVRNPRIRLPIRRLGDSGIVAVQCTWSRGRCATICVLAAILSVRSPSIRTSVAPFHFAGVLTISEIKRLPTALTNCVCLGRVTLTWHQDTTEEKTVNCVTL
jgi:hypothetical protein